MSEITMIALGATVIFSVGFFLFLLIIYFGLIKPILKKREERRLSNG